MADVTVGDNALHYADNLLTATGTFRSSGTDGYVELSDGILNGGEEEQQASILLRSDMTIESDVSISMNAVNSISLVSGDTVTLSAQSIHISGELSVDNSFSGTFMTQDNKTVTVTNGIITSIL